LQIIAVPQRSRLPSVLRPQREDFSPLIGLGSAGCVYRITPQGYRLRLPFRLIDPARRLDIWLDAILDVSLSVQGQGIVYATCPVQLRRYSPLLDKLELNRRTRFFPDEWPWH
jgi:hypothetical protein